MNIPKHIARKAMTRTGSTRSESVRANATCPGDAIIAAVAIAAAPDQ